jgi:hypothetical protein
MPMPRTSVTAELLEWDDVGLEPSDSALLLGNGASVAVWEKFRYSSHYERAQSDDVPNKLVDEDTRIFDSLKTKNFEEVLRNLMISGRINRILGLDLTKIKERYDHIRQALIDAVCAVHVPWETMMPDVLEKIGTSLIEYNTIFSTNYDLLVYWALMCHKKQGFKDYFWSRKFDVSDTSLYHQSCRVIFLHGALHLFVDADGNTWKRKNDGVFNLLELFRMPYGSKRTTPLFITEGNAEQKLRAIQQSDYLYFAFRQFEENDRPLVVLGHSLSEEDAHLIKVIQKWCSRQIAFGIYSDDPNAIMQQKLRLESRLRDAELTFFKSTSHPLGATDVRIGGS